MSFSTVGELAAYYLAIGLATINGYDDYKAELTSADSLHVRYYEKVTYHDGWYEAFLAPFGMPDPRYAEEFGITPDTKIIGGTEELLWIRCTSGDPDLVPKDCLVRGNGTVEISANGEFVTHYNLINWVAPPLHEIGAAEFLYNVHTGDIKPLEDPSVRFDKVVWTEPMRFGHW